MIKRIVVLMIAVGLCASTARGGIVSSGDVNPSDPATWTDSTDVYIGQTGVGGVTVDDDSDVVSDSGYLGYESGGDGSVTVNGAGSTWTNSDSLQVGRLGSGLLEIINGGYVVAEQGNIGVSSGSTGAVTVSGSGSVWTNTEDLHVGRSGNGSLEITNEGSVDNVDGYIGNKSFFGSGDVIGGAVVSGAGSVWANSGDIYVGYTSPGTLDIIDGGAVSNTAGFVGYEPDSTGEITVSGPGSIWSNADLTIGEEGHGVLNIINGGLVQVSGDTRIAIEPGSTGSVNFNNGVLTTDCLLGVISDMSGTGTINTSGLIVDVDVVFDTPGPTQTVILDDPGQSITVNVDFDGSVDTGAGYLGSGVLEITDGGTVSNTYGYVGYAHNVSSTVTVSGAGSSWTCSEDLSVGAGTSRLDILEGGRVSSKLGYINGSGGVVTVSGPGSTWIIFQELSVGGYFGDGELYILNGGVVSDADGVIGNSYSSIGEVTVSGAGSTWTNSGDLVVGDTGDSLLVITDGGSVSNVDGEIGYRSIAGVNVSGVDSTWTNSGDLIVGNLGNAVLEITNGAAVNNVDADIGYHSTSAVIVRGSGSTWTNSGVLHVGRKGSATMNISSGASVSDTEASIALLAGSTGVVTVSGPGATWTNSGGLYVGGGDAEAGGDGQLTVSSGGLVDAGSLLKVWGPGSVSVTGGEIVAGGSPTGFSGWLTIGSEDGAEVSIVGGSVSNSTGAIGYQGGSTGTATVSGVGATWTNNLDFYVGYNGSGVMEISDGGFVSNRHGIVGGESGASGSMTVRGDGAVWGSSLYCYIGFYGDGALDIIDRGTVTGTYGLVGQYSGSTGKVTVSGAGSTWSNGTGLRVGRDGDGTVEITDGGVVSNGVGYIGYASGSTGAVTVSGAGSKWANSGDVYVGRDGDGVLNIYTGGLVSVGGELTIDDNGGGDSFVNMGDGGMLALFGNRDDSLGDFLGLVGGTDAIRYWDESIWDWSDMTGATPGGDYTLSYMTEGDLDGYTVLTVTALIPTPGDTNRDSIVDDLDLVNLVAQFGGPPGGESADFDGDDFVGLEDFAFLRDCFGSGVAAAAPEVEFVATTPEPATLILLATGLPVLLRLPRRRRFFAGRRENV
ncbi:MAG: hypothetical protein QGH60_03605 [Phycisphaerae bacterium]|jgi:T5SS/PEP-CTERM-associated repeat protein|nr:hypothetical protein [Phycisphaerae bacterium]